MSLEKETVIMEIRAGTGGQEAALFASDLFRMYKKFSEKNKWRLNILQENKSELGGIKEIIFELRGPGTWQALKQESGVHRVQRIPKTEKGGRIHTSTASVVVISQNARQKQIEIRPQDLKIETFRASGHGGQHVNVTDSAVRITHLPTGTTVSCQQERSQYQNKEKAMKILQARLSWINRQKSKEALDRQRKRAIAHSERSEKIRTYNFPQNRVTDHRIKKSWQQLDSILEGDLEKIIKSFKKAEGKKR